MIIVQLSILFALSHIINPTQPFFSALSLHPKCFLVLSWLGNCITTVILFIFIYYCYIYILIYYVVIILCSKIYYVVIYFVYIFCSFLVLFYLIKENV